MREADGEYQAGDAAQREADQALERGVARVLRHDPDPARAGRMLRPFLVAFAVVVIWEATKITTTATATRKGRSIRPARAAVPSLLVGVTGRDYTSGPGVPCRRERAARLPTAPSGQGDGLPHSCYP